MGKIDHIRKENAKMEQEAPYNFCNRWCERCSQDIRDRCKVYQDDFETRLRYLANGKDPDDWEAVLETVQKNFEKTAEILSKMTEEKRIDLNKLNESDFEDHINKEIEINEHLLYKATITYAETVKKFIEESFDKENISPESVSDFEIIVWYHTLLPVKIHRFLSDIYVENPIDVLDEEGIHFSLYDAVAQADISIKCIRESQKALVNISKYQTKYKVTIIAILEQLNGINAIVDKILSEIDK